MEPHSGVNQQLKKKLLLIGIDGCRPDCLLSASCPNISKIYNSGAYSFNSQTSEITISGPAWCSCLSGVWESKLKVVDNNTIHYRPTEAPHIFDVIRKYLPEFSSASVSTWKGIDKFAEPASNYFWKSQTEQDHETMKELETTLSKEFDAFFVHLDMVDHAGHDHGFSPKVPEYISAIERTDENVGKILDQLYKRPNYKSESWLIMLCTDHGGHEMSEKDENGYLGFHGYNIPEHRRNFIICNGESLKFKGEWPYPARITDVAATIGYYFAGDQLLEENNLDGMAVGIKEPKEKLSIAYISAATVSPSSLQTTLQVDLVVLEVEGCLDKHLAAWVAHCESKMIKFSVSGPTNGKFDHLLNHKWYISRGKSTFSNCAYLGPMQLFFCDKSTKEDWISHYPVSGDVVCLFGDWELNLPTSGHHCCSSELTGKGFSLVEYSTGSKTVKRDSK